MRDAAAAARRSRRRRKQHRHRPRATRPSHRVGQLPWRRCGGQQNFGFALQRTRGHAMGAARSATPDRHDAEGSRERRALLPHWIRGERDGPGDSRRRAGRRRARSARHRRHRSHRLEARMPPASRCSPRRAASASSIQIFVHGLWGSDRRRELVLPVRRALRPAAVRRSGALRDSRCGRRKGQDRRERRETAAELARRASALGPREVVVRSAASIGVLARGSWTALEIRREAAVDPIGAGDAFNAGYIAVRLGTAQSRRRFAPARAAVRR